MLARLPHMLGRAVAVGTQLRPGPEVKSIAGSLGANLQSPTPLIRLGVRFDPHRHQGQDPNERRFRISQQSGYEWESIRGVYNWQYNFDGHFQNIIQFIWAPQSCAPLRYQS